MFAGALLLQRSSRARSGRSQIVLVGEGGGRGARGHADLEEDVRDVASDRPLAEVEGGGDFSVRPPRCDEPQYLRGQ